MEFLKLIGFHVLACAGIGIVFGVCFRKMMPAAFIVFSITWIGLLSLSLFPRVLEGIEIHAIENAVFYLALNLFYSFAFSIFVFPGFFVGAQIRNFASRRGSGDEELEAFHTEK